MRRVPICAGCRSSPRCTVIAAFALRMLDFQFLGPPPTTSPATIGDTVIFAIQQIEAVAAIGEGGADEADALMAHDALGGGDPGTYQGDRVLGGEIGEAGQVINMVLGAKKRPAAERDGLSWAASDSVSAG